MDVRHADSKLERLELDCDYTMNFAAEIVKAYRKRLALIRAAVDERDLYAQKSVRFEKLKGKRSHQRSMRLNDQFRLILALERVAAGKGVVIISIEDYH